MLLGSNSTAITETYVGVGGDDFIDGRGGFDQVNYLAAVLTSGAINVQLAAGIVTGDDLSGTDTLRSIEAVAGSPFVDTYNATGFSGS